jgi:hypothetical protein
VKLGWAVSRGRGRLVPHYPTFGAQSACSTRLFWIGRTAVCANALPKSAPGMNRCRYRMLDWNETLIQACRCNQLASAQNRLIYSTLPSSFTTLWLWFLPGSVSLTVQYSKCLAWSAGIRCLFLIHHTGSIAIYSLTPPSISCPHNFNTLPF